MNPRARQNRSPAAFQEPAGDELGALLWRSGSAPGAQYWSVPGARLARSRKATGVLQERYWSATGALQERSWRAPGALLELSWSTLGALLEHSFSKELKVFLKTHERDFERFRTLYQTNGGCVSLSILWPVEGPKVSDWVWMQLTRTLQNKF